MISLLYYATYIGTKDSVIYQGLVFYRNEQRPITEELFNYLQQRGTFIVEAVGTDENVIPLPIGNTVGKQLANAIPIPPNSSFRTELQVKGLPYMSCAAVCSGAYNLKTSTIIGTSPETVEEVLAHDVEATRTIHREIKNKGDRVVFYIENITPEVQTCSLWFYGMKDLY